MFLLPEGFFDVAILGYFPSGKAAFSVFLGVATKFKCSGAILGLRRTGSFKRAFAPKSHERIVILVATAKQERKNREGGFLDVKTPSALTLTPEPRIGAPPQLGSTFVQNHPPK